MACISTRLKVHTALTQLNWIASIHSSPQSSAVWSPSPLEPQARLCFLVDARKAGTQQYQPPLLSTISLASVFRKDLWSPATFTSILCPGKPAEKKMHLHFLYMDILLRTVHLSPLTDAGNRCIKATLHYCYSTWDLPLWEPQVYTEVAPAQKELSRGCQCSSSELPNRLKRADS